MWSGVFIGVPDNVTFNCTAPAPSFPPVTAHSACLGDLGLVLPTVTVVPQACGPPWLQGVWQACDPCGNCGEPVTRFIIPVDSTPPFFIDLPPDVLFAECNDVPGPPLITPHEDCSSIVSTFSNVTVINGTCPDSYTLVYLFSATDCEGRSATFTQPVHVNDTKPPVFASNFSSLVLASPTPPI